MQTIKLELSDATYKALKKKQRKTNLDKELIKAYDKSEKLIQKGDMFISACMVEEDSHEEFSVFNCYNVDSDGDYGDEFGDSHDHSMCVKVPPKIKAELQRLFRKIPD